MEALTNRAEPRVPVTCADLHCSRAIYVEREHADNIRAAGWTCLTHTRKDTTA